MVISSTIEMQEAKPLVMQLTLDHVPLTHKVNVDIIEAGPEVRVRKHRWSTLKECLGSIVIHILDFLICAILAPFKLCHWVFSNEQLLIILRILGEVTIELIVWTILAGVAVTLSVTLIMDEIYSRRKDSEKLKELLNSTNEFGSFNTNRNSVIGNVRNFNFRKYA